MEHYFGQTITGFALGALYRLSVAIVTIISPSLTRTRKQINHMVRAGLMVLVVLNFTRFCVG